MKTERETTRIVRSWLETGADRLPDRVLDSVLDQLAAHRQRRRPLWRPRKEFHMNALTKTAIAAAAVLVVLIAGYQLLPGNGPGSRTTPSPSPTVAPVVIDNSDADTPLVAGTYRVEGDFEAPYTITFPTSWRLQSVLSGVSDFRRVGSGANSDQPWLNVLLVEDVFIDPCHTDAGFVAPRPTTVDEYVTALTAMVGFQAGPVSDIELESHAGKFISLSNNINTDTAGCTEGGFLPFLTFRGSDAVGAATNGQVSDLFWIVDVDATIVVINAVTYTETAPDVRAEVDRVVLSMDFD